MQIPVFVERHVADTHRIALGLEVEQRDVRRWQVASSNVDAHPINDVIAMRLDEEAMASLSDGINEERGEFGLPSRVEVDFRLLQDEPLMMGERQHIDQYGQTLGYPVTDVHHVCMGAGPDLDLQSEGITHLSPVGLDSYVGEHIGLAAKGDQIIMELTPFPFVGPVQPHHEHRDMRSLR